MGRGRPCSADTLTVAAPDGGAPASPTTSPPAVVAAAPTVSVAPTTPPTVGGGFTPRQIEDLKLTPEIIAFLENEEGAELERIRPMTNPTFLEMLYDASQEPIEIASFDYEWAPGVNVQISTSIADVAIWGTVATVLPAATTYAGTVTALALTAEAQATIGATFTVATEAHAWYKVQQESRDALELKGLFFLTGPFTVRVPCLQQSIPDGYAEADVGMFHTTLDDGVAVFSRVENTLIDTVNQLVYGKVDDFSIITLGILTEPEPVSAPEATPAQEPASTPAQEPAQVADTTPESQSLPLIPIFGGAAGLIILWFALSELRSRSAARRDSQGR